MDATVSHYPLAGKEPNLWPSPHGLNRFAALRLPHIDSDSKSGMIAAAFEQSLECVARATAYFGRGVVGAAF